MKAKLILSIVSFSMCLILFATLSFAWFMMGTEASGENGDFNVISENTDVDIYHLDGTDWKEGEGNFAEVGLVKPSDVLFFKLTVTKKDKSVNKVTQVSFLEPILKITDAISCEDGIVYVTDLKGNKIKMYELDENNQVKIDGKVLYNYNEDKLELQDFLLTNSLRIYCDDSLANGDETAISSLTPHTILETLTINKEFGSSNILEIYFAIEICEEEMIFDGIDYSKYFAYQYFKLTGIETEVE